MNLALSWASVMFLSLQPSTGVLDDLTSVNPGALESHPTCLFREQTGEIVRKRPEHYLSFLKSNVGKTPCNRFMRRGFY